MSEKELQCEIESYKRYCDELLKMNWELNHKLQILEDLIQEDKKLIDQCLDQITKEK